MPQTALIVVGAIALGALVWWIFTPSRSKSGDSHTGPATGSDGSPMRVAEMGMVAVTHGLKASLEDPALVDRFDFPPFGRGEARRATEVLKGSIDGEDALAFHYSFELPGEVLRREFDITVVPADFRWKGRLRVASVPRVPGEAVSFDEAWRVDERPSAKGDPLTPEAQAILMEPRFKASAVVVSPQEIVLIDGQVREFQDVADDAAHLRRLRAALAAK